MVPVARVNGIDIAYDREGAGPAAVFIHGMAGSRIVWNHVAPRLADVLTVVLYDCRGHGSSSRPKSYTLRDHVEDLAALLDHMGFERAHVIGHSMGSFIAQAFALDHPDRCDRLVLISTRSGPAPGTQRQLIAGRGGVPVKEFIGRKTPLLTVVGRMKGYPAPDPDVVRTASRALANFDLRDRLGEIRAPTLILQGDEDRITPLAAARETAAGIPGATLEVLEGYGHFLHVECPDILADRIRSFCSPPGTELRIR